MSPARGSTRSAMLETARNAYILFGIEPSQGLGRRCEGACGAARRGRRRVHCVRCRTTCSTLPTCCLPIGTFAETAGTFVNAEGRWQSFDAAADAVGESRPGWRVLRVLGNELELPRCEYRTPSDVAAEVERELGGARDAAVGDTQYKGSFAPHTRGGGGDDRRRRARRADLRGRRARPPRGTAARHRARPAGCCMNALSVALFDWLVAAWQSPQGAWQILIVSVLKIVTVLVPLILGVAYFTYWERKILAWMHVRIGPNRVGWKGVLQPFADVIKMLLKEIVLPAKSNKFLFLTAPVLSLVPAFAVWAVVPMSDTFVIADIDAGLLYVLALTSLGIYGVILAGLGVELEVRVLGRHALGGADGGLRDRDGLRARRRADGRRQLESRRHHPRARGRQRLQLVLAGRCSRCSSSISSRASPRRTARRSTSPRASRRSSRASTSSTPVSRSACSSSPSTRT